MKLIQLPRLRSIPPIPLQTKRRILTTVRHPANHPPTQRFLLPGDRDVRSGWQRCPNTAAPHSDCVSVPLRWQRSYTPVAADVGNYLRYYVYYETRDGEWTRQVSPFTTGVVAAVSP